MFKSNSFEKELQDSMEKELLKNSKQSSPKAIVKSASKNEEQSANDNPFGMVASKRRSVAAVSNHETNYLDLISTASGLHGNEDNNDVDVKTPESFEEDYPKMLDMMGYKKEDLKPKINKKPPIDEEFLKSLLEVKEDDDLKGLIDSGDLFKADDALENDVLNVDINLESDHNLDANFTSYKEDWEDT